MTAPLDDEDQIEVSGLNVTSASRLAVDLARARPARDAVVAADALLRRGLVDRVRLEAALERATRWPGIARARLVIAFADGAAESPLESIVRLLLAQAGLPQPRLQVWLFPDLRVDLLLPYGVVVEADGLGKYTDANVLRAEKLRQERLEQAGYVVVRVTWNEAVRHPAAFVTRVRAAMERASRRAGEGLRAS